MSYLRPEIEEPGLSSFKGSVSRIGKGVQHLLPGLGTGQGVCKGTKVAISEKENCR